MEIMDEDVNVARITTLRERQEHLRQRLASLRAEQALVENELASLQGSLGVEAAHVPIEDRVTCKHFCAHHTALMDPAVWRNLPEEVVQMVFARLPLHQIVSLQCLSKAWRWNVIAFESGFRRLCASARVQKPNMFALVDQARHGMGIVSIKLFDVEAHKWRVFEMTLQPQFYCETMSADGGLVCFVSRMLNKVANPLLIVVLNPLTKEYKVLPTLASLNRVQPQMVQLIMDRETKCYKVVLVGKMNRRTGTVLAKVYSSATGRWSNPDPVPEQLIFGYHFRWTVDEEDHQLAAERVGPCAYACHEAEFLKLGDHVIPSLDSCKGYTLVNNRLFALHCETRHQTYRSTVRPDVDEYRMLPRFVLSEYQGQRIAPYWVRVRVHECTPLERPSGMFPLPEIFQIHLHACRDSLMISVENDDFGAFELVRLFLYDLFTFKWQEIPAMPRGVDEFYQPMIQAAMCELHWDAVP